MNKKPTKAETLFDCWKVEGEDDPERFGHYLKNGKFKKERVLHNVTMEEARTWHGSAEVCKWAAGVWARKLTPSYYFTVAEEDEPQSE